MPRVLVPLAAGFEEIEAVSIVDVLRRAGCDVVLASVDGADFVQGSHGIALRADAGFDAVADGNYDLVVLPGGEPGVTHLGAHAGLMALLGRRAAAAAPVAAICAAPRLLAAPGWLRGRQATSHPSVASAVRDGGATYDDRRRVVRDGPFLTSRGPGTALEFALGVLELLGLSARAEELRQRMLVGTSE